MVNSFDPPSHQTKPLTSNVNSISCQKDVSIRIKLLYILILSKETTPNSLIFYQKQCLFYLGAPPCFSGTNHNGVVLQIGSKNYTKAQARDVGVGAPHLPTETVVSSLNENKEKACSVRYYEHFINFPVYVAHVARAINLSICTQQQS